MLTVLTLLYGQKKSMPNFSGTPVLYMTHQSNWCVLYNTHQLTIGIFFFIVSTGAYCILSTIRRRCVLRRLGKYGLSGPYEIFFDRITMVFTSKKLAEQAESIAFVEFGSRPREICQICRQSLSVMYRRALKFEQRGLHDFSC